MSVYVKKLQAVFKGAYSLEHSVQINLNWSEWAQNRHRAGKDRDTDRKRESEVGGRREYAHVDRMYASEYALITMQRNKIDEDRVTPHNHDNE